MELSGQLQRSSVLYVAWDVGYINQSTLDRLFEEATEVARFSGGLRAATERMKNADHADK